MDRLGQVGLPVPVVYPFGRPAPTCNAQRLPKRGGVNDGDITIHIWSVSEMNIPSLDQGIRGGFSRLELVLYAIMVVVLALGMIIAQIDEDTFRKVYVREDGVLETATALMLFSAGLIVTARLIRERSIHPRVFTVMSILIAFAFFFVAGEEVSWGQRIFGIETNEFFAANNLQEETNFHNLEVAGINLNKLIFSKMLVVFLLFFFLIFPLIYRRGGGFHDWLAGFYVPVPKVHHGLAMLAVGLFVELIPSSKRGELNEVCLGLFALMFVLRSQNIKHGSE